MPAPPRRPLTARDELSRNSSHLLCALYIRAMPFTFSGSDRTVNVPQTGVPWVPCGHHRQHEALCGNSSPLRSIASNSGRHSTRTRCPSRLRDSSRGSSLPCCCCPVRIDARAQRDCDLEATRCLRPERAARFQELKSSARCPIALCRTIRCHSSHLRRHRRRVQRKQHAAPATCQPVSSVPFPGQAHQRAWHMHSTLLAQLLGKRITPLAAAIAGQRCCAT